MLSGKGFSKVFNMSGGIKAWQGNTAVGPQDLGIELFAGSEGPLDVLKVAYSLEKGLGAFYLEMEETTNHPKVKEMFHKLAGIEIKHQDKIIDTYNTLSPEPVTKQDFQNQVEAKVLEGGLSTQEYLDLFGPNLDSEIDVISLAMSIEAQALDLYQRVGSYLTDKKAVQLINTIADEEKIHLQSLGNLLDSLGEEAV